MTERPPHADLEFLPAAIRGVVFDLDGTLVDSYAAITVAVNAARERFDEPALSVRQIRRRVGHGLDQLMRDLLGPERADEGARLFRATYEQIYLTQTSALPGAVEALDRLDREGIGIAVASNKPALFSRAIVQHLRFSTSVTVIHGPDTVGTTKPEPTMIRTCLRDLGVEASAAVYVGDMVLDAEAAAQAGVPVLLVTTGSSSESELRACGRFVYPGISEIAELLIASRR